MRWRRFNFFFENDSLLVVFALAAAAAGAAIGFRVALTPLLPYDRGLYMISTAAVLAISILSGTRAGVICTFLSAVGINFIWLAPRRLLEPYRWPDIVVLSIFLAVGLTVSTFAGRLRRARYEAEILAANEAEARHAAQESGERFRRMFEQGPLGIVMVALDHRVLNANTKFCQMLGYSLDELRGRTIESLTPSDGIAESQAFTSMALEGRIPGYNLVKQYVRKDGTPFWVMLSVALIRDAEGRPAYALGMVQDISEQKRMAEELEQAKEEAEAASRAKDHFLAVLSHELRTPLTPILLTTSSMEVDPALPTSVRENVHMIRQNVELEARLIDDLLDLTSIARGKLVLHRMYCDAHALIGQALYTVQQAARDKGLTIRTQLDAPRSSLDCDPARVQQVFWNLLKNAIKFTPAGGQITIRTRLEQANDAAPVSLVVEVRDTGVGIPQDALPGIFRAFDQGAAGVTKQFGGLGLGLTISQSIVELHGGRIEAASEGRGHGAMFTVRLPLAAETAAESPTAPSQPPSVATSVLPSVSLRILLVEDHPATRRAMASILRTLGHDVHPAATLAEALAESAIRSFDLVISDLALPDGSGHDLMRQLKAAGHPPHAVAVSGYGMPDDIRRSREAGFDQHLTKPVSQEKLRDVLTHVTR